jgi:hypothetical protein
MLITHAVLFYKPSYRQVGWHGSSAMRAGGTRGSSAMRPALLSVESPGAMTGSRGCAATIPSASVRAHRHTLPSADSDCPCSVPSPPQATRSPGSMLKGWWHRELRLRRTRECVRGAAHVRAFLSPAHSPAATEVSKSSEASSRTAPAALVLWLPASRPR